ncbi:MAG: preprotein translocase subunit YajC [Clostridia bacterium]|nr:preprotein translocase subunit YajC [Clostridia bacterium]
MIHNKLLFLFSSVLAEGAEVAEGSEGSGIAMLIQFGMMALIFGVFYMLLIRPQRKKDKKVKEMLGQLKVGDRVTTIGGIHGTIVSIKDDTLTLAVGTEKVKLVFARWAIRNVDEVSIANDQETLV